MDQRNQILLVVSLTVFYVVLQLTEGKSLGSLFKLHKIKKRSLYEETCPPPYIIDVTEQCNDSCLSDDYCVGNQMCCFDGCSYVCMDPVPSEPVIDWLDDKGFAESIGGGELEIVNPVIEELGCQYHGMTLNDGEAIALGCRRCSCFNGNMMCDVKNCNKDYQYRLLVGSSGSGFGDDEEGRQGDSVDEQSGDQWFPIHGLKIKEEFIPFRENKEEGQKDVKKKEEFISFRDRDDEDDRPSHDHSSGEESGDKWHIFCGVKIRKDFRHIPFKEDDNEEQNFSGSEREYMAMSNYDGEDEIGDGEDSSGYESGEQRYPVHGLKLKEDFIPFWEDEKDENKDVTTNEDFFASSDNSFEKRQRGKPQHNTDMRKNYTPYSGDTGENHKGDDTEFFAKRFR